MDINILAGPAIGAVIGYCTNYIAVKMLFRPLKPVKVFGHILPFTPGIIPKGKDRLAKAIGLAVGNNLLTEESMEKTLLSSDMKEKLKSGINRKISDLDDDDRKIHDVILDFVDEKDFDENIFKIETMLAKKFCDKVTEMDIGKMVADEAVEAIKENSVGSIVARFLSDNFLYSLVNPISSKIDEMVKTKGTEVVYEKINSEFEIVQDKTVGSFFKYIEDSGFDGGQIAVNVYETFIKKRLGGMLKNINVSKIIQDKIDEMGVNELEEMVMEVMKKELNAIVNLGALIGLILGLFNLFFSI